MYCGKCGAENPDGYRFCEKCGAMMTQMPENQGSVDTPGSRKKLFIGGGIALTVILICIIVFVVHLSGQTSPEYNEKIAEADRYLEEMDYDKAETAYLEAIEIEPKVDDAYLKLADTYVIQEKYEEAEDILEEGKENAGGEDIQQMLEKVTPYNSYYEFLEAEVVPDVGLADVDETFYWGENGGLVSALVQDINDDEIPELITVTYGKTQHTTITMSIYTSEDGEVTLVDEYVEDDLDDGQNIGTKIELFLKEYEGKFYLGLWMDQIVYMDGGEYDLAVYQISEDGIQYQCKIGKYRSIGIGFYTLNNERIAEYDIDPANDNFQNISQQTEDQAIAVFEEALAPYGLIGKLGYDEYENLQILGYDVDDESENNLAYIQQGEFSETGSVDFMGRDWRFLNDYTDLRSKLNR